MVILDPCRSESYSHTLTHAGVINRYSQRYLTPAVIMQIDILDSILLELYIEIHDSCRSHAHRYLTPAGFQHKDT